WSAGGMRCRDYKHLRSSGALAEMWLPRYKHCAPLGALAECAGATTNICAPLERWRNVLPRLRTFAPLRSAGGMRCCDYKHCAPLERHDAGSLSYVGAELRYAAGPRSRDGPNSGWETPRRRPTARPDYGQTCRGPGRG